ncbi:hypothetical protein C8R44DRAFT_990445 [Mycena epipterygia]|nr:hypothetical protein C8R44DRAFT_990445 [Mycena epipterygia]
MFYSPLSSTSTGLESVLLCTPRSPRFSVAGRFSYSTSSFAQLADSPELESDIGLQNPRSPSDLSNTRITYSDVLASSHCFTWPSSPELETSARVPVQRQADAPAGGKSSMENKVASGSRRRRGPVGWCAPISQFLFSPSFSFETNAVEICVPISQFLSSPSLPFETNAVEICAIDIFSQTAGVGLGLGLTMPLLLVQSPRSTHELTVVPSTAAQGSICSSASTSPSVSSTASSPSFIYPTDPLAPLSPPPRFSPVFNSTPSAVVSESPSPVPASPADPSPSPTKYDGLGHGLPSHMRGSASRLRLSSIPEEEPEAKLAPAPIKLAQHAGVGLGLPPALRSTVQKKPNSPASPQTKPLKSRLQSTVHELFSTRKFAKRPLFSIPEARSREVSAEEHEARGSAVNATEKGKGKAPAVPHMSPAMRLAAQSIIEEDRKFRKKEGLARGPTMSPTMRLAAQMVRDEHLREEQEQEKKSWRKAGPGSGSERAQKSRFKFLF